MGFPTKIQRLYIHLTDLVNISHSLEKVSPLSLTHRAVQQVGPR
jgi:hypothetical protein